MKKKTIAQLKKIYSAGVVARKELDARESAALTKVNKALIGKCQRYRNSYGSGSPDWWLYRKILSVDGNYCTAFNFQTDCNGKVEIERERHGHLGSGWQVIPDTEYEARWADLLKLIESGYKATV